MAQGLLSILPPIFFRRRNLEPDSTQKVSEEIEKSVKQQEGVKQQEKEKPKRKNSRKIWTIKITLITFFLTVIFSCVSDSTMSKSNILVAFFIVLFLIIISIIFDGIGVAVTSCDIAPLYAMAARKVPGSKIAISLVKNADKVSNICADVIGDICGIISGACCVVIVSKIIENVTALSGSIYENLITVGISSIVAALTVGGKALGKNIAINNSREFIMSVARILAIFKKEK